MAEQQAIYYTIYLAVSSDTNTGKTMYGLRVMDNPSIFHYEGNSTGPCELLRGMIEGFDEILKNDLDKECDGLVFISNSQYITKMINDDQISHWHDNGWVKDNGDPCSAPELLKQIYRYCRYFKERSKLVFVSKPESIEEETVYKALCKTTTARRKAQR